VSAFRRSLGFVALFAAVALGACSAGVSKPASAAEPGTATPIGSKDAFEIDIRPGWPAFGASRGSESKLLVDLARGRLRSQPNYPDPNLGPIERETSFGDADRAVIVRLARAMLGAAARDERTSVIGCLNVTDGDNSTLTIMRRNGRRERYGCGAPPGTIPIREADFTALVAKLKALLDRAAR
jgi:hypothetical protein